MNDDCRQNCELPSVDDLVAFEMRWFRQGGGTVTEIYERFGLQVDEFFSAVLEGLERNPPGDIRTDVVRAMMATARRRLWMDG